ncbi:MAG: phosphoribosylamine--glycine ligase [Rhodospirillaceae bacterium]|nr:phosphoribosylamine--glycine ligase [Rhodospirillaceae bacterium]
MNILVVGSGGREHALCWAIAKSPKCTKLYCAPGNAGTSRIAVNVDIVADHIDDIVEFATSNAIDLVVVGPEAPLVAGLVDKLEDAGIKAFGPSAAAAALEGSKGFMKDLCARHNIPTADYGRFNEPDAAKEFILRHQAPIVVKADGLAAGKGVIICCNKNEAYAAIDHIMTERAFGSSGAEVVIEEFLEGEEASFFVLVDGETALAMRSAQDHKAAFDGDEGPNTGGMGAYTPAPIIDDAMSKRIMDEIIKPTIKAMSAEGMPYKGVLFAGLMITEDGPKLIEYNVRFGDPECQALMLALKSDILDALLDSARGNLKKTELAWHNAATLVVVMAAEGYPGRYDKGSEIKGVDKAEKLDGVVVFHAGTQEEDGRLLANGGRVLGIAAQAKTVAEAQKLAYKAIDKITWTKGFNRTDIGWRAINR